MRINYQSNGPRCQNFKAVYIKNPDFIKRINNCFESDCLHPVEQIVNADKKINLAKFCLTKDTIEFLKGKYLEKGLLYTTRDILQAGKIKTSEGITACNDLFRSKAQTAITPDEAELEKVLNLVESKKAKILKTVEGINRRIDFYRSIGAMRTIKELEESKFSILHPLQEAQQQLLALLQY